MLWRCDITGKWVGMGDRDTPYFFWYSQRRQRMQYIYAAVIGTICDSL